MEGEWLVPWIHNPPMCKTTGKLNGQLSLLNLFGDIQIGTGIPKLSCCSGSASLKQLSLVDKKGAISFFTIWRY